ncbi:MULTISPECIES: HlyD family type I secretion periplasmic adaptor subunit [unclassified Yoonia]|uniref:HlyD family type I secretion periplasmic adaptor subunit n=1 Tax=unclassified Yoonia TaxID=2629118 RepID=UPI002AFF64AD|nr:MULTISPECIES: HlyD family type I secretion periplasmic adaptor subunit [unclassified Yoonia]
MTAPSHWPVRHYLMTGGLALGVLLGGFGAWAMLAQISGAVIVSGQIEVDRNRQVVQHPFGGVVQDILVGEGDHVAADDLLIRLDASDLQSDLFIVEGQLFEIMADRARLEAERDDTTDLVFDPLLLQTGRPDVDALIDTQLRLFAARLETNTQSVEQLHRQRARIADQITGISKQQAAVTIQRGLIARELADQQNLLDRGLAQASRVLTLQREDAALLGRFAELTAQAAQAGERMTEIDIQILGLGSSRREEAITRLRDLQSRQLELTERRQVLLRQLKGLDIRAPVSGVIYGMQVFAPRAVILPADPFLYIVPQDRPLVFVAQVPTVAIDQVFLGQAVTLRFPTFDQRRTPELTGHITLVSADAFRDDATSLSYYRVEVELNDGEMQRLPANTKLLPGMPVDAFMRTDARSLLDYLTKPLTDYVAKAFRER